MAGFSNNLVSLSQPNTLLLSTDNLELILTSGYIVSFARTIPNSFGVVAAEDLGFVVADFLISLGFLRVGFSVTFFFKERSVFATGSSPASNLFIFKSADKRMPIFCEILQILSSFFTL